MLNNSYHFKSNHRKLVSIQVAHNYFNSGFLDACQIIPTPATLELLRNYEVQLRRIAGGMVLIGSNEPRFKSANFNGGLSLNFYLVVTDPFFLNYTDIPYDVDKSLKFSNSHDTMFLHVNEFVDQDCQIDTDYGKGINGYIELVINKNNEFFGEPELENTSNALEYLINFNSRKIVKRFNITGNTSIDINEAYFIEDDQKNDLGLNFKERSLASGTAVFAAIMDKEFQLTENLTEQFYLKKRDNTFYNFSKFFPNPKINNLSYDRDNDRYILDSFVQIS